MIIKKIKATLSGSDTYDDELRKSDVMFIENTPETEWIYNLLAGLAIQCNKERYWFDLLGFHNNLQLASYTEGDFFDWPLDFGTGEISDRKLSIILMSMRAVIYSLC